mgnify:CR=1 FL=1
MNAAANSRKKSCARALRASSVSGIDAPSAARPNARLAWVPEKKADRGKLKAQLAEGTPLPGERPGSPPTVLERLKTSLAGADEKEGRRKKKSGFTWFLWLLGPLLALRGRERIEPAAAPPQR